MTASIRRTVLAAAALIAALPAGPVLAQSGVELEEIDAANGPYAEEYIAALNGMYEAVWSLQFTGDPEIDFARGILLHQRAATELSTVFLEFGEAPELRQIAEDILALQERELPELERWLTEHDQN